MRSRALPILRKNCTDRFLPGTDILAAAVFSMPKKPKLLVHLDLMNAGRARKTAPLPPFKIPESPALTGSESDEEVPFWPEDDHNHEQLEEVEMEMTRGNRSEEEE